MSVKIRLQRHGKKGKPFYWIVAADARSKRDGKFLEKLGTYNPNTNPATIDLNVDGAVQWLHNGAQPVSYTHLDVYKRQKAANASRRASRSAHAGVKASARR